MLIGQRQVNTAAQESIQPIESPEVPPAMTERIRKLAIAAYEEAQDIEVSKAMREAAKFSKKRYKAVEKEQRARVTEEVNAMPVYQADSFLTSGKSDKTPDMMDGMRLDTQQVKDILDVDKIPASMKGRTSTVNSIGPDELAVYFEFESGADLVMSLDARVPKKEMINQMTDRAVVAEIGDPNMDPSTINAGMEAVHNESYETLLMAELDALTGQKLPKRVQQLAAQQRAKDILKNTRRNNMYPSKYYRAAATQGKLAVDEAGKGNHLKAADHVRLQLLNHYLFKQSTEMTQRYDKAVKRLRQVLKLKSMHKIRLGGAQFDTNPADVIAAILGETGIGPEVNGNAGVMTSAMDQELRKRGMVSALDTTVEPLSYQIMTYDQMMAVTGNVNVLVKTGRDGNDLRIMGEAIDMEKLNVEMQEQVDSQMSKKGWAIKTRQIMGDPGVIPKMRGIINYVHAFALKLPSFATLADGGNANGVFNRTFLVPLRKLESEMKDKQKELADKIGDILGDTFQLRAMNQKINFMGKSYSRVEIMAALFNMGNDTNLRRLIDGNLNTDENGDMVAAHVKTEELPQWRDRIIKEIEKVLEPAQVQQVFAVAKVMDRFDQMSSVTERVTGRIVKQVDSVPLTVHGITSPGYYYPIKYLNMPGNHGSRFNKGDNPQAGISAMVDGFTKERVTVVKGGLNLDPRVIGSHLESILHYETYLEYGMTIDKLINNNTFERMINDSFGPAVYKLTLEDFVTHLATNGKSNSFALHSSQVIETVAKKFRRNVTSMRMSFNTGVSTTQLYGAINTLALTGATEGPIGLIKGMGGMTAAPVSAYNLANEKSAYMRHRLEIFNSNMHDNLKRQDGVTTTFYEKNRQKLDTVGFAPIQGTQGAVDYFTWNLGYAIGLQRKMSDDQAINHADALVERSQGSGGLKDRTPLERSGELMMSMHMHYSFWGTAYGQLASSWARINPSNKTQNYAGRTQAFIEGAGFFVGPAFVATLIAAMWSDEDEEVDDIIVQTAAETIGSMKSTIPFLRNIPLTVFGLDDWAGSTPYDQWFRYFSNLDLSDGMTATEYRSAAQAVAAGTGIPADKAFTLLIASQLIVKGEHTTALAWMTGSASWWEIRDKI
jgi:hypothetical protein